MSDLRSAKLQPDTIWMDPQQVDILLQRLAPNDLVLDVGAWASPFNRAQWVLDSEPYETRGFYRTFGGPASQGGNREWFTRDTWVRRDICDRDPWPFAERQIHGLAAQEAELERFINTLSPCPPWKRQAEALSTSLKNLFQRALARLWRVKTIAG